MSSVTWVYIMLGLYIVYCLYEGLRQFFKEKTSAGYAVAGRSIPFIAFLMAATAASFSGWTFIGHPGLIYKAGLAYAFASFYVLTIPISGAFFAKRNWLLGKRYGFITPGDMFAYYYNSESMRWVVVLAAVFYSLFYCAVQLMAAGALFNVITGVDYRVGAIFLAVIVWFYVCAGGIKASAWVGVIQFILLVLGIVLLGYYVIVHPSFGGWTAFSQSLMEKVDPKFLTVPDVMTFGLGKKGTEAWTSVMVLTYMFALMGIQSSPAFIMWNFGIKSPKPLAWQQTFMSTFVVGFALFFFTAFQGMGGKILELTGDPAFQKLLDRDLVPMLMKQFLPPFMVGIVFMGAIAAIHSTAAPYINTGGSILLRDIYWRYIRKQQAGDIEQLWVNRILATVLTALALIIGMTSTAALVILGALATAFGFLMYLPLLGTHYGIKMPSLGVLLGLIAGMVAVFLTYKVWPNPLSMHSAFWGLFVGLVVAFAVKGLGINNSEETRKRQAEVRTWIDSIDSPSPSGQKWRDAMKWVVPIWYFFAIGPACIMGNSAFSFCGFPPLWSWQIFWWILGIIMMWALTFKAEMSTTNETQIRRADVEQMLVVKQ
ncbi:MAG: sodium:solute symporter [Pseudomonadota bacterium]